MKRFLLLLICMVLLVSSGCYVSSVDPDRGISEDEVEKAFAQFYNAIKYENSGDLAEVISDDGLFIENKVSGSTDDWTKDESVESIMGDPKLNLLSFTMADGVVQIDDGKAVLSGENVASQRLKYSLEGENVEANFDNYTFEYPETWNKLELEEVAYSICFTNSYRFAESFDFPERLLLMDLSTYVEEVEGQMEEEFELTQFERSSIKDIGETAIEANIKYNNNYYPQRIHYTFEREKDDLKLSKILINKAEVEKEVTIQEKALFVDNGIELIIVIYAAEETEYNEEEADSIISSVELVE